MPNGKLMDECTFEEMGEFGDSLYEAGAAMTARHDQLATLRRLLADLQCGAVKLRRGGKDFNNQEIAALKREIKAAVARLAKAA